MCVGASIRSECREITCQQALQLDWSSRTEWETGDAFSLSSSEITKQVDSKLKHDGWSDGGGGGKQCGPSLIKNPPSPEKKTMLVCLVPRSN